MVKEVFPLKLFGAVSSSVLLWASFFPGFGWLVWFSLVPLFGVLSVEKRWGRGIVLGAVFGALFSILEFMGLLELRDVLGLPIAILSLTGMAVWGALWSGIFGALGKGGPPLRLAGLWTLLEILRSSGAWGVALGTTPLAFVGTWFLRTTSFLGPWGLGLAVSLTNALLAYALTRRRRSFLFLALFPLCFLALLGSLWGVPKEVDRVKVALVQPGIGLTERLEIIPEELLRRYRVLLSRAPSGVDLVVFPEDAIPAILDRSPSLRALFIAESKRLQAPIIVGSWSFFGGRYFNTAFLFHPRGEVVSVHRKVRLLPFGEYVPLRSLWEKFGMSDLLNLFLPRNVAPGKGFTAAGHYGVMICSESMFPSVARVLILDGARVLIALTNDSWFGSSRILWEHFACGALRATETGRAFLQAAVTGVTGGFGPDGRLLGVLEGGSGILVLEVPLPSYRTVYARIGDWPVVALTLLFLTLSWLHRTSRSTVSSSRRPWISIQPGGVSSWLGISVSYRVLDMVPFITFTSPKSKMKC